MASSIINLMYFAHEDTFYYVDVLNLEPAYYNDFMTFYGDIIAGVNTPNPNRNIGVTYTDPVAPAIGAGVVGTAEYGNVGDPIGYYTRDTGDGAFPFMQSISLTNIAAENVLTQFVAGTTYNFHIEVQNQDYNFSAVGSALETWQDIVELIENNTPASVEYYTTTKDSSPYIRVISHVEGQAGSTGGDGGGTTLPVTSQVRIFTLANIVTTGEGTSTSTYAHHDIGLNEPTASDILTLVPSNTTTVFQFAIGRRKNLAVQGNQARTYQDVVDTINKFDGVNCIYQINSTNKHMITLYVPIPKSPTIAEVTSSETEVDPTVITRNSMLRAKLNEYSSSSNLISIEDFSGLTTNSKILHDLGNSIFGGYTLMSVIQNSKRSNGSYWTEIVPIQNNKSSADDISAKVPEQAEIIEGIDTALDDTPDMTDDVKRKMSLDLGTIIKYGGALAGGQDVLKSALVTSALSKLATVIGNYFPSDPSAPPNDTTDVETLQSGVDDDGYVDGAIDPVTGDVLDDTLLTPAQKSKLVPPTRTTVS